MSGSAQGVSGNDCGAASSAHVHMLLIPIRPFGSITVSAPARWPIVAWPVASQKKLPVNTSSRLVFVSRQETDVIRPPSRATAKACVFKKRSMFGSARTTASFLSSPNSSAVPGLFLALSANSSTISPMSGYLPRFMSPIAQTRISLEPLPPSTGRSWISATLSPMRAAAIAAPMPE